MTSFDTIVMGAGPAGTGPLLCALQRGDHERLLERRVLWIDRRASMVGGSLGEYDILSDTASDVLLECLQHKSSQGPLQVMLSHPATEEVRSYAGGPLPLAVAGRYLNALGRVVAELVQRSTQSRFLGEATVTGIDRNTEGFAVHTSTADGPYAFTARRVVFALGGYQAESALLGAPIARTLRLVNGFAHKTMISSALVTAAGQAELRHRLSASADPRVAIIGGSHSAVTAAWLALHRTGATFDDAGVRILCRRLPKIFYPSRDAARSDGYQHWTERDVCPVTGRVFRLSGLRLAARDLMRAVWALGGCPPERRVGVVRFDAERDEDLVRQELMRADVVIAAFGYRPRTVPVMVEGRRATLLADARDRAPLVDEQCRVLLESGEPLPDAYGIGLASGFVPHGNMGGEPSFDGQTNGLWLYQNGIGEMVLEQLLH